jgi:hypothetical protein
VAAANRLRELLRYRNPELLDTAALFHDARALALRLGALAEVHGAATVDDALESVAAVVADDNPGFNVDDLDWMIASWAELSAERSA